MLRHVVETALNAELKPVLVVTGANADQLSQVIEDLPVQIIHNPLWQSGQSTSLNAGLKAIDESISAVIFLLADQPQINELLIRALVAEHEASLSPIVAPLIDDQRGNPVLFDRVTFPDLFEISGDVGGRAIFDRFPIKWVDWQDPNILLDVDTEEDYQQLINLDN